SIRAVKSGTATYHAGDFSNSNAANNWAVLRAETNGSVAIEANTAGNAPIALLLSGGGHVVTVGTAPTVAMGTGAVSAGSTDMAGSVTGVTTGTVTIQFAKAYSSPPIVIITPSNALAASAGWYLQSTTSTDFTVYFTGTS